MPKINNNIMFQFYNIIESAIVAGIFYFIMAVFMDALQFEFRLLITIVIFIGFMTKNAIMFQTKKIYTQLFKMVLYDMNEKIDEKIKNKRFEEEYKNGR